MTGIPAAAQLLLLPFFPESPRYLLIQKKDSASARKGEAPLWEEQRGQGCRTRALGTLRPPSDAHLLPSRSAAAAARLGGRGQGDGGDPAGGRGREGRGLHLRGEAVPDEVPALAAHLRHHPHGRPAAVGSECGKGRPGRGRLRAGAAAGRGPAVAWPSPPASGVAFQIYYYADQIYVSAGVNTHDVQYVTVGTGAINVVVTFLAVSVLGR